VATTTPTARAADARVRFAPLARALARPSPHMEAESQTHCPPTARYAAMRTTVTAKLIAVFVLLAVIYLVLVVMNHLIF
jgi:hypothetical protein